MQYTIVIPTYNEAEFLQESIQTLIRHLESMPIAWELLIADNGSSDATLKIARLYSSRDARLRVISHGERGPGRAFAMAVKAARGEWIITQDADLSSELAFLDYVSQLSGLADVIIGSKTFGRQRRSVYRVFASQLYVACTQLLFDLPQSDFSIGCKAFKRSLILKYLDELDPWTGFIVELSLYLHKAGHKIVQVGVNCDDHRKSRFNLLHEGIFRFWHLWVLLRKLSKNSVSR